MDRLLQSRRFSTLFLLAASMIVLLVYSNSFTVGFQFDDLPTILDSAEIKDLASLPHLIKSTRGLTLFTFALNYAAGGTNVIGYHIVNVAIHIINLALAYFLLLNTLRLAGTDEASSRRLAALASLIFAVHPVQTQAVTYIVQRMETLASLFYMAALLLFIRASAASSTVKRAALYAGVALSYLFAFYSKEIAFTLPAAVLLYDFCFIGKGRVRAMLKRWPVYALLFALFAAFTVSTVMPLGGFGDVSKESEEAQKYAAPVVKGDLAAGPKQYGYTAGFKVSGVSPKEYLYTQFDVIVYYMALLAVPVNQNLDYDFPWAREFLKAPGLPKGTVLNMPLLPPVVSFSILLAIAALGAFMLAKTQKAPESRLRVAGFFIFWFFIILSPTSSIVPIIDPIYEHRVYLASLGFFAVLVLAIDSAVSLAFGRTKGAA